MKISKEQIKKAFVSDPKDIGEEAYNNQDWYQQDEQRLRYILATFDVEENTYRNCITFNDKGEYQINDEQKLSLLMRMDYDELSAYVEDNELDWIGDDYDHINEYLYTIMNEWQDEVEFEGTDMQNPDCMTITKRTRKWFIDKEEGYKSENKYDVAYSILMEYWDSLPDEEKPKIHARLEAIGV